MTVDPDLIFEEPPNHHGGGLSPGESPVGRWLDELRGYPGMWAKYPESRHAAAVTRIRQGTSFGVKPGEFEARSSMQDGKRYLYARYVTGAVEDGVA